MSQEDGVLAFIDDGYTRDFYIRGEPGLYPEVRFTARPMVFGESDYFSFVFFYL